MLEQVEFIGEAVLRCWKGNCGLQTGGQHVSAGRVLALLKRYEAPPLNIEFIDSQLADLVITRHWVRHML